MQRSAYLVLVYVVTWLPVISMDFGTLLVLDKAEDINNCANYVVLWSDFAGIGLFVVWLHAAQGFCFSRQATNNACCRCCITPEEPHRSEFSEGDLTVALHSGESSHSLHGAHVDNWRAFNNEKSESEAISLSGTKSVNSASETEILG